MNIVNLKSPQNWHELTTAQLLIVSELYLQQYNEPEFLTHALIGLTGIVPVSHKIEVAATELLFSYIAPNKKHFQVTAAEIHEMAYRLKWLLAEPGICTPPDFLPYIPVNNRLYGVSTEQYLLADALYIQYAKLQTRELLERFAAVLYRSTDSEQWSNQAWKNRMPHFQKLSAIQLNAVFIWFTGVKAFLKNKYPYIFSGSGETTTEINPNEHILRLLAALNGGDVTRNRLIMETHIHEVLFELNLKNENNV